MANRNKFHDSTAPGNRRASEFQADEKMCQVDVEFTTISRCYVAVDTVDFKKSWKITYQLVGRISSINSIITQ